MSDPTLRDVGTARTLVDAKISLSDTMVPDGLVGRVVAGRYRVVSRLGAGGMGEVYRAEHLGLAKLVALKVLRGDGTDPESAARFQREAMTAAHLEHPNIARCMDVGILDDGSRYLVLELIEGEPLSAVIAREGVIDWTRALPWLSAIASGLASAHHRGIVHRDLKPDNVIVTESGAIKIIDFGIAHARSQSFGGHGATALTKAGTLLGTPAYMAPEQVVGQPVDTRADQYSLGVIAFELLTGKPPFEADDPLSLVFKHVGEPLPSAQALNPSLPQGVDAVLERIMAKLPAERFETVTDAVDALQAVCVRPSMPLVSSPALSTPAQVLASVPAINPFAPAVATAVSAHTTTVTPVVSSPRRGRWVALAAGVLLALGLGFHWISTRKTLVPEASIATVRSLLASPGEAPREDDHHARESDHEQRVQDDDSDEDRSRDRPRRAKHHRHR
ncbi:MAG: serine/threonine-protein kinase [Deltaproteobacteria bacterium]|nr:serine/threonine-protein kinase [Deltaproteobacteria bacterium]